MIMKKLIVHVGPHKTGTTYIQGLLHKNREILSSLSVSYPDVYYLYLGHHYLLNELNGRAEAHEIRSRILAAMNDAETCILSSENFILLSLFGLKKLKNAFPEVDFKFVIYSRRPSLRLISRWHELVKQGSYQSMESYFVKHLFKPMKSREVNVSHYIKDLINVYGEDSFRLVDYETASFEKNMMSCFLRASEIEDIIEDNNIVVNKMTVLEEIEIIRMINYTASKEEILRGSNVREKYYFLKENKEAFRVKTDELSKKISLFSQEVTLGNAGFDTSVKQLLEKNYSDSFVNSLSPIREEKYRVPSTDWIMDTELRKKADNISYEVIENFYDSTE